MKLYVLLATILFSTCSIYSQVPISELTYHENRLRERNDPRLDYMIPKKGQELRKNRTKGFSIFDPANPQYPKLHRVVINTSKDDYSRCIISYASNNPNYISTIQGIIQSLEDVGYKGHFLYRVGGWPNMEMGCLEHCHVPYGFKACAFQEASILGYEKALWIDTIIRATQDLTPLFDWIGEHDCLYRYSYFPLTKYMNKLVLNSFNLTLSECKDIQHTSTMVMGFNLQSPQVNEFLNDWHKCVEENEDSHFSFFPSQLPFSILLHRHNLLDGLFTKNLVDICKENEKECYLKAHYNLRKH